MITITMMTTMTTETAIQINNQIVTWTAFAILAMFCTATWYRFRFGLFIPLVIRMVTLYHVVILSFLNHLHLNNGSDKTGSVVH